MVGDFLAAARLRARKWQKRGATPTVGARRIAFRVCVPLVVVLVVLTVVSVVLSGPSPAPGPARSAVRTGRAPGAVLRSATGSRSGGGYWLAASDGGVFSFGDARFFGSASNDHLRSPVVGIAATPDGGGYWLAASDGGVFSFGDARFFGSASNDHLRSPVVGIAATPDGGGYWLAASDGGVFSFGDARFFGSASNDHLRSPVVGIAATPDGGGYWLAASDGGVFSFGDARFFGSASNDHLRSPVVGIAATPDGGGYWLAASDGGVFSFGDARFFGSASNDHLRSPVVGIAATPDGGGYWLAASDGGVFSFGDASFFGSASNDHLRAPVVGANVAPGSMADPSRLTLTPSPDSEPALGVMEADPAWLETDADAGIREAVVNANWSQWEPRAGVFDASYAAQVSSAVAAYRSAGWTVGVDIGLESPPGWALALPEGKMVDQRGETSSTANFVFSQPVRSAASAYIDDIVSTLGTVQYYRIGLSQNGEMLYPETSSGQWWAFDADAQGSGSDLPSGAPVNPMPGWVPGESTWAGAAVTTAQVQTWYDWYLGSLEGAEAWEIDAFRAAGFDDQLQLVMPGDGAPPQLYAKRIADHLAPETYDPYSTMESGAVWWKVIGDLADLPGLVVDISSVGDGSGAPTDNACQASDATTPLAQADPWVSGWSDTRWLSYLARQHGLPVVGENPGNTPLGALGGIMQLARGCGLGVLQWAWDYQLHGGSGTATLAQVSQALGITGE